MNLPATTLPQGREQVTKLDVMLNLPYQVREEIPDIVQDILVKRMARAVPPQFRPTEYQLKKQALEARMDKEDADDVDEGDRDSGADRGQASARSPAVQEFNLSPFIEQQVSAVVRLWNQGVKVPEISWKVKISTNTVRKILKREGLWSDPLTTH